MAVLSASRSIGARLASRPLPTLKGIQPTVPKEIIARTEGDAIHLVLQWQGSDHTAVRFQKVRTGQHRYIASTENVELIRALAAVQSDSLTASVPNRIDRRAAHAKRGMRGACVCIAITARFPSIARANAKKRDELAVSEVTKIFGKALTIVRHLIRHQKLANSQVCVDALSMTRTR